MFHLECTGCGTSAYVGCPCPPEAVAAMNGQHLPICALSDLGAAIVCPPGSSCCQDDHSHDAAANACTGGHGDCPEPGTCTVFESDGCDGGHCHKDIPDCTVCRPIRVTVTPGNVTMQRASA